ncbi:MAG: hypothetical protein QNI92_03895 [Desulfobacterales bacterium]|nr:hypothetical protein [Desulfobacterales bacterium]
MKIQSRSKLIGWLVCFLVVVVFSTASSGWAKDFMVYPAKGQSMDQMEKDKFECYRWAKEESGFDPMDTPTASKPPPAKEKEVWGAGKTGLAGAAGGAIIGGLTGGGKGAGRGALIGGAGGALIGGARRSDQRTREEQRRKQWEQEQVAQYTRNRNNYNRAYSACLEGRGYTVR